VAREREKLKRGFLELLEKDVEFRYAVASYLGLSRSRRGWRSTTRSSYESPRSER